MERVHKGGAKFDFEKAKWFNHEWIKKMPVASCELFVKPILESKGIDIKSDEYLLNVVSLVKDRCTLLNDFYVQSVYFFQAPQEFDLESVKLKWSADKADFFTELISRYGQLTEWNLEALETCFKALATEKNIKVGDVQFIYRIMLVGGKYGPGVFHISEMIGKQDSMERIQRLMGLLG